jgi:eukaryotic-like serine/threonine-protein kinase
MFGLDEFGRSENNSWPGMPRESSMASLSAAREQELFAACLELAPTERRRYLERACTGAASLQERIERLIAAHHRAEQATYNPILFTGMPAGRDGGASAGDDGDRSGRVGDAVGPYRLLQPLADGGMGSVWLAERTDGMLKRPVALKLPRGAWRSSGLAARMAREREILAALSHPNIASLYDAGLATDGQPYLALEYVEGRRIDEYCRDQCLDLRARLRLFVQVANAVAHAHGKLVVHRDLKPANVLVDAGGQVRLLDFGIAKLLQEGQAQDSELTQLSGRPFTLDYASPEQIGGQPITIGSDVYSLGVVLCELLANARPYLPKRDSLAALEEAILRDEPLRPSELAAEPKVRRALRGDLDTIVLKALKKKPEERYATVNALVEDIERYLQGRPVHAQPDSRWYRIHKFVARNRLAVGGAAAALLAVLIGAGVAVWQARVALAEAKRTEEVKDFIVSTLRDADPYARQGGPRIGAIDLLRTARVRVERELAGQPQARLELLAIIGESLHGLRENAEAAEVLEQALREASSSDADDGLTLHLRRVLARAYGFLGRPADSRRELRLVVDAYQLRGRPPDAELIKAKLHEGTLDYYDARYVPALSAAAEVARLAATMPNAPADAAFEAYELMAMVHQAQERLDLAVQEYERAYRLALQAYRNDERHPRVLELRYGYSNTLEMDGRPREALEHARAAATLGATIFGPENEMLGYYLGSLANIQLALGEIGSAIENSRKSIAIYQKTKQPGTRDHSIRMRLLSRELLAARRPQEAAELLAASLEIESGLGNVNGQRWSAAHYGLALAYLGRFVEAEAVLAPIVEAQETTWSRARINALWRMGTLRRLRGDARGALSRLEQALVLASQRPRSELDRGEILAEIGLARLDLALFSEAVAAGSEALRYLEQVQVRETPAQADALMGMGRAQLGLGRAEAALGPLERADAFWRQFDAENRWAGEAALWLGRCYAALGRSADARRELARAERVKLARAR